MSQARNMRSAWPPLHRARSWSRCCPCRRDSTQTTARIRSGADEYWQLFRSRSIIRTTLSLTLLLVTVFVFFSSVWLAVFLSKQITRPVEALADAMDEIAAGKYEQRVADVATGEMGDLVRSFNHMAADLEASRQLAETAQAQLTAANLAIEERRRELETIVETIPSGVVTLDGAGVVLQANRAFAALMGLQAGCCRWQARASKTLLPAECADDLASVIRRGQPHGRGIHRVGISRPRAHPPSGHHQRAARSGSRAIGIGAGG